MYTLPVRENRILETDMKQIMGILTGLALVAGVIALAALVAPGGAWAQDGDPTPVPDPVLGELDLDAVAEIDLEAVPVIPEIDGGALALYEAALDAGRDPHAFAKVGDCMTDHPSFLIPIGEGDYDLGEYADLETVIAAFRRASWTPSRARARRRRAGSTRPASSTACGPTRNSARAARRRCHASSACRSRAWR